MEEQLEVTILNNPPTRRSEISPDSKKEKHRTHMSTNETPKH